MKEISKLQLISLTGGCTNPEKCRDVQYIANEIQNHPELLEEFDWSIWCDAFDMFCLGS